MESIMKISAGTGYPAGYAAVRTDGYVLLASLLGQAPSEELLAVVGNLQWEEMLPEQLDQALGALRQAARDYPLATLENEFNQLFVGLGSGELVPYASWYREKTIQSAPLASLRSDLLELGIVRQTGCREAEDHAGAICEIMALASQQSNKVSLVAQARFFKRHIASWMMSFFQDLQSAKRADFYRLVGLFGRCFLETENRYLNRDANIPLNKVEGGLHNEKVTGRQPANIL